MNKFNEIYNQIITGIEYRNIDNSLNKSIPQFENGVIYEDCAFHRLPRKFTDKLISIINEMVNEKIIEKEIDIREPLKLIKLNEVENFKDFFEFIQLLINSSEKTLTLKLGFENSFQEPDELYELSNIEYSKIFHDEPFKENLIKKLQNVSKSNALKIMKENINEINQLGTITINPKTISLSKYEFDNDDNTIGHEIRHFIIFLQRFSKLNYEICRKHSYQKIKEYDRNNPDFKSYSLHEDEFITLSSTLIERLVNIFLKYKKNIKIQEVNLLIKSIFAKSSNYDIKNLNDDLYWYNLFDETIPHINSIIQFFKNILDDRKYKIQNDIKSKNDKFLTLMRWTYNTFYEKLQEIKNQRQK